MTQIWTAQTAGQGVGTGPVGMPAKICHHRLHAAAVYARAGIGYCGVAFHDPLYRASAQAVRHSHLVQTPEASGISGIFMH